MNNTYTLISESKDLTETQKKVFPYLISKFDNKYSVGKNPLVIISHSDLVDDLEVFGIKLNEDPSTFKIFCDKIMRGSISINYEGGFTSFNFFSGILRRMNDTEFEYEIMINKDIFNLIVDSKEKK